MMPGPFDMPQQLFQQNQAWDLTEEKRFHLVPAAKLLITIPWSNDRLVLRRVDIERFVSRSEGQK
jgi:hypothetical protein